MTSPKNPFFAKAVANRYWAHFFGRGIVDPLDDMRVTNPPSNPELLDALAQEPDRQQVQPEGAGEDDLQEPHVPAVGDAERVQRRATSSRSPATTRSACRPRCCSTRSCKLTDSPTHVPRPADRQVRSEPGDHAAGRVVRVVLPGRDRPARSGSAPASASASTRRAWR